MDPYKVLGISRDATPEQIKKAYRQKAKQYHPDLHPDDHTCTEKMNQVNEAYDRLTHPEKYKDTMYGNSGSSYQNGNPYAGYQSGYGNSQNQNQNNGGYGNYQNQNSSGYGNYQNQNNDGYGNYQGQNYGGYQQGPFTYFDMFGFGNMQKPNPQPLNADSREFVNAIYYYNSGEYEQASQILNNMVSNLRNDRWNYLSAIVNYERGQKVIAMDQIQKAMQASPYNQEYKQAYMYMNRAGNNYQSSGREYTSVFGSMGNICLWYMALQCCCMFCH